MKTITDRNGPCDYRISKKCDGTLRGRYGTIHKVYEKPEDVIKEQPKHKYACIECEMLFDED